MAAAVTFANLNRYQIRDAMLGYWQARYIAALGIPLQTGSGTPAFQEAETLGVIFEPIQTRAAYVAGNIFPDSADTDSLNHHGAIDGVPRKPATAAVEQVQINGTPAALVTYGTSVLQGINGLTYLPSTNADGTGTSVTLDGSGHATIYATCTTLGIAGNLTSGTMVWSALPTNATNVVTILGLQVTAADVESDPNYAIRIVFNRQNRPGSGNRADWQNWTEAVSNVAEAYVYPELQPGTTTGLILGTVTVVPLGAAPAVAGGGSVPSPRILVAGDITNVQNYIEGAADAQGRGPANPAHGTISQLRPVTIPVGNYSIELPSTTTVNVQMHVTLSGLAFPFVGTFTTAAGSSTTVIHTSVDPTGTVHNGDLVAFPDATVRGGYALRTVTVGASTLTVSPALGAIPPNGLTIYPAPSNWQAMTNALLALFDRLGPGDTTDTPRRFPPVTVIGPAVLFQSALTAAVMGVPGLPGALPGVSGVQSVTLVTPVVDTTPAPKQLILPGTITFVP